jgi:hypothetical protein
MESNSLGTQSHETSHQEVCIWHPKNTPAGMRTLVFFWIGNSPTLVGEDFRR